jgi:hypothetical protein
VIRQEKTTRNYGSDCDRDDEDARGGACRQKSQASVSFGKGADLLGGGQRRDDFDVELPPRTFPFSKPGRLVRRLVRRWPGALKEP